MGNQRRIIFGMLIAVLIILLCGNTSAWARSSEIPPVEHLDKTPAAYIVVDANKGTIVSSKNMHDALNVASTSKIVTALAAVNTIRADQDVEVPEEAKDVQPMKIGMTPGQKWKRDDLLYSLLLVSANDAAYALADASAHTISSFAKQEDNVAKQLGMKDSSFGDPSGLDDGSAINGDTKMSAYDLAIAARAILAQPLLSKIVGTASYQFTGGDGVLHTLTNHNQDFLAGYAGANGMKTGYTKKAGRTMIASATHGANTLIAVVLNAEETDGWAARLLDAGFSSVKNGKAHGTKLPAIGVISSKANITILNEPSKSQSAAKASSAHDSGSSLISLPLVTLVILSGLVLAFILRRRAIKKRKLRRRQRANAIQQTRRREMIDVIDLSLESESELVSKV
jgi:D-alanyl-D-alanine carboxypeptidase